MKKIIYFLCFGLCACADPSESITGLKNPVSSLAVGPALLSPDKDEILDNGCWDKSNPIIWDFDWNDVSDAEQYHIYVKGLNAIYPAVDTYVTNSQYQYLCDRCYITPYNSKNWNWKVRAKVKGEWTDWSTLPFEAEEINTDCKGID